MKYLSFFVFIFIIGQGLAQESVEVVPEIQLMGSEHSMISFNTSNFDLAKITTGSKLISIGSNDVFFNRTYLVNRDGESLSNGFGPAPYFRPNDNLIVITGSNYNKRDSFNPYGADDVASVIILSTVNTFISRIKSGRRKKLENAFIFH